MSLVLIDNTDPWLIEYNRCEKLYQKIVENIGRRNEQPANNAEYSKLSATVRLQLRQYSNEVEQLKVQLLSIASTDALTSTRDEKERRQRMVEQLQSSNIKVTNMYNIRPNLAAQRRELLADAGTTGWGDDDDEDASDEDAPLMGNIDEIREQRQIMIEAQNQGLDALSTVISRQKNIAISITDEVGDQNVLVDNIADRMDHTHVSLQRETGNITTMLVQDSTCSYWVIIIILFIANVVVLLL